MAAFDRHGEHVEKLAQWTREELAEARHAATAELWRWKRARDEKQVRLDNAKRWYEEECSKIEQEARTGAEKVTKLEQVLDEYDAIAARQKWSTREKQAEKQTEDKTKKIAELTARLLAGDVAAAEELRRLVLR